MRLAVLRIAYRRIQSALYTRLFSSRAGPASGVERNPIRPGYLIAVYRLRNSALMERVVNDAERAGLRVGLWSLDECSPSLRRVTLDVGPGSRTQILTQLDHKMRESAEEFVLVTDDDFEFVHGDLATFVQTATQCGFMLSQPGHIPSSNCSYSFNHCRPWLTARSTTFVEAGPIVLVHPAFHSRVFPMPSNFGMGWGLEFLWLRSLSPSERFGIVDSVWIRHLGMLAADYQCLREEVDRYDSLLRDMDLRHIKEIFKVTRVWWRWRQMPRQWAWDSESSR